MDPLIREQLFALSEEEYRIFTSRLLPGTKNILGVRLPALRKIAREIAKEDWRNFLKDKTNEYFEETMLQGMVIGYGKAGIEEILGYVTDFVPKIDNWSVCDSFCNGLKITKKNKEKVWEFLKPYFSSDKEFHVRFGVVMLLHYYIDDEYIDRVLDTLDKIEHEGYYVRMAVAWAVSVCYIKMSEPTLAFLRNNHLDDFTYNKSLQKITESLKVDKETKAFIRTMRRY